MHFIPLFYVVILNDPYFHEIVLPINASYDKFSFLFSKHNIFVIIAFVDWWRK
jgi:hypothetical protein